MVRDRPRIPTTTKMSSTLNPMSAKRLREIADGTRNRDGSKKITAADIQARRGSFAKKVADILGGKKSVKSGHDTRRIAKARAWTQFSMFIRLRDAGPDGYGQCVTCPRNAHWRTMDAGHWITRAKEATLFDERNVHLQCKGCNKWQGGKPSEHKQAIIRKYGPTAPDEIETKAVRECKRTLNDYLFIEQTYRERVENIRANDPGKFKAAA